MCRTRTDMAVVVADYYTYSKGRCVDECTCMCSSNLLFTVDKRNEGEEEEEKNLYCCSVRLLIHAHTHTKNVKYQETHSSCAVCLSVSRSPFLSLVLCFTYSVVCIENVDDDGEAIFWRKKKEKRVQKKNEKETEREKEKKRDRHMRENQTQTNMIDPSHSKQTC